MVVTRIQSALNHSCGWSWRFQAVVGERGVHFFRNVSSTRAYIIRSIPPSALTYINVKLARESFSGT